MSTNIAVRVDASSKIGTGHFMRCLTLAEALKQRGALVRFISRQLPEHLHSMLAVKGYEFALLGSIQNNSPLDELAHADWLGVSQAYDAADSVQALSDRTWDWLIVDHYALDARWESALRCISKKILVIDDIADRRHDCEMLLDQNFYSDMQKRYTGKVPNHCRLLLGPRYALLRDEFRQLRERPRPRSGPVNRILVFFGGVDTDNYTGRVIEALLGINISDLNIDVVVGQQHPFLEQIRAACARHGFVCHIQTDKMAELMAGADMAIGAGGSATWERCCLGLPTLVFCAAHNQQRQIADAAQEGLLYWPGIKGDLNQTIQRHATALAENNCLRNFISRKGMLTVDGRGVLRVIASMECDDVEIRLATLDDSEKLFRWRNHQNIREVSRNTGVIGWQEHQRWIASVLANPKKMLLIGHHAGSPVGVIRFDVESDEVVEISIYLVPEDLPPGLGRSLLHSAEQWIATNHPEIHKIRAQILGVNERSQRLFAGAGYQIESISYLKMLH